MSDVVNHLVLLALGVLAGLAGAAMARRQLHRLAPGELRPAQWIRPLSALGMAIGAVVALRAGMSSRLPTDLAVVIFGMPLATADMAVRRLPTHLVWSLLGTQTAATAISSLLHHDPGRLSRSAIAFLAVAGSFLLLAMTGSLGGGDIRLAATLAAYLASHGWPTLAAGLACAMLLALSPAAMTVLSPSRHHTARTLPFGPYLVAGALLAVPW